MVHMATPRWLDDDEQATWRAYRRMNRLLYAALARDLTHDTGLSDPDYEVLSTLTEATGRTWRATELGAHLQWSTSRLAHHIGRMEQRGLVNRESCSDDGRGAVIRLTKAGRQTIQRAAPHHVAAVRRRFIDRLTPEQLITLRSIGDTIAEHLNEAGLQR
jgi:DNA-binding MarR family transcriptional regulator